MSRTVLAMVLTAGALVLAAACGGDGNDSGSAPDGRPQSAAVTVNLKNWAMEPSSDTMAAGRVEFTAVHDARHGTADTSHDEGATHQLLVAPLLEGASAGQGKFGTPVLNLTDIKPGEMVTGAAEMTPGTYELACLVIEQVDGKPVNHYELGMYRQVSVE